MGVTNRPRRKPTRLPTFDYRLPGPYFVTICTHGREHRFGAIVQDEMQLNNAGEMVAATWESIPEQFPTAVVDLFVVMPNHFHGLIWFNALEVGANPSLGDAMKWFKSGTTNKYIRGVRTGGWFPFDGHLWQRNYHEHVVRNATDMDRIRAYIVNNPATWPNDTNNVP